MQNNQYNPPRDVPKEYIGAENQFIPTAAKNTAQRLTMSAGQQNQTVQVKGFSFPKVFAGNEIQHMEYILDPSKRKSDVRVVSVIPKFTLAKGASGSNPSTTLIVVNESTREADVVYVEEFQKWYDGFGASMNIPRSAKSMYMSEGAFIPKEAVLMEQPNMWGDLPCVGLESNIAMLTHPSCPEDTIWVSEEMIAKCSHEAVHTVKYGFNQREAGIALYTDGNIFPDLGEPIREDGIILGTRDATSDNIAALARDYMTEPMYGSDNLIKAKAGAVIVDVNVYCPPGMYNTIKQNPGMAQPLKYLEMHYRYNAKVVDACDELVREGYSLSPKLSNLQYRSLCLTKPRSKNHIKLSAARQDIDNFYIELTYKYTYVPSAGTKITGMVGDKGVVIVKPVDHLPVDGYGNIAHVVCSSETFPNRTNAGQSYNTTLTFMMMRMHHRLLAGELGDDIHAYGSLIEFLSDISPEYGDLLASECKSDEAKLAFVDDVREEGMYLHIVPFASCLNEDMIEALCDKWNHDPTPVTFKLEIDGKLKSITTKDCVEIGSKYFMVLCKTPISQLIASEVGYENQINIPVKPSSTIAKLQSRISVTTLRYGEDECGLLNAAIPPEEYVRHMLTRGGSNVANKALQRALLTEPSPSTIGRIEMSTAEMQRTAIAVALFYHQMVCVGFDVTRDSVGRAENWDKFVAKMDKKYNPYVDISQLIMEYS